MTRVMAHPTDPLRALITVSGFGTGHVFETNTAFMGSVRDVSGNLSTRPRTSGSICRSAGAMIVGTDVGVFQSIDGGISWTTGPAGMPNVIVYDLVYQQAIGLLVAGTYGRGMFAYDVGMQTATLRGDVNGDGKIDAADALLIQQALVGLLPVSTAIYPRGDANCNGSIDAADVVLVLRAAVGLSTTGRASGRRSRAVILSVARAARDLLSRVCHRLPALHSHQRTRVLRGCDAILRIDPCASTPPRSTSPDELSGTTSGCFAGRAS